MHVLHFHQYMFSVIHLFLLSYISLNFQDVFYIVQNLLLFHHCFLLLLLYFLYFFYSFFVVKITLYILLSSEIIHLYLLDYHNYIFYKKMFPILYYLLIVLYDYLSLILYLVVQNIIILFYIPSLMDLIIVVSYYSFYII